MRPVSRQKFDSKKTSGKPHRFCAFATFYFLQLSSKPASFKNRPVFEDYDLDLEPMPWENGEHLEDGYMTVSRGPETVKQ